VLGRLLLGKTVNKFVGALVRIEKVEMLKGVMNSDESEEEALEAGRVRVKSRIGCV
jgi:hypothetical protein